MQVRQIELKAKVEKICYKIFQKPEFFLISKIALE